MSLLTLPETSTASTTLLRKPDSLRVRLAAGEAERVVKLADGKTTIGSSPQCTIVLPAADCRPLQCVVTVDPHRAEATRWGAGVQLNLRDFSKSTVAVGDKLTIGRCEIEFATTEERDEQVAIEPAAVAQPVATEAARPVATPALTEPPTVEQPKVEKSSVTEAWSPLAPTADVAIPKLEAPEASQAEPALTPVSAMTALVVIQQPQQPSPAPLASRQTIVIEPEPKLVAPVAEPTPTPVAVPAAEVASTYSSHAFADELILQLWQAGDRSQRRAKSLIAATRDARFRTDAMAADLAAMEVELDLARAAYDSHAADHEQLHLELIQRDRRAAERIGPLAEEVETLRSQLQEAQIELAEQAARCDELNAALEIQDANTAASTASQAAELARAAELEQSLTVQIEQATLLAHELGAVRTELDGVRKELEQQATRRQELEAELAASQAERDAIKQQADEAADQAATILELRGEVESLHDERTQFAGKLSDAEVELSRLSELCHTANDRVAELEQTIAARDSFGSEATAAEPTPPEAPGDLADPASAVEPTALVAIDDVAWNTSPEPEPAAAETPSAAAHESGLHAWTPVEVPVLEVAEPTAELTVECSPAEPTADANHVDDEADDFRMPTPAPVQTVPVASELAPTSFIDKYRHLLDDESAAASSSLAAPPLIDDEFLSPAKAADRTVPADDSDEALDSYMASMMQRMRSHSPSALPEPAPLPPVAVAPAEPAPLDYDPSVPFEIESMKQGRRAPASTDLAALREIANTSARSAIATHRKKRKVESAIGKVIVALTALGTAGFLIWNAPSFHDWQFGSGVAVGLIGLGAAALALRHPDRAAADHRVEAHPAYFAADESAHGEI
ncbi:MAG: hypothetical protein C0485_05360 [Pirellula sp.]|nr:hypothetical protein [Pirellula sp.]